MMILKTVIYDVVEMPSRKDPIIGIYGETGRFQLFNAAKYWHSLQDIKYTTLVIYRNEVYE